MIKCLIFDCDGTLVDSEYLCNLGLEVKLREYGIASSASEMMKKYRGGKLLDILTSVQEEHNVLLKENFVTDYRDLVEQLFERDLNACTGVHEFLTQNKVPVCIASSGPRNKINKALEITGLKKYFDNNIFSSYEINSWKPDPEIFLHASKQMGVDSHECLVIEDSTKGIEAGLAAGMKTILFDPTGLHSDDKAVPSIDEMNKLKDIISAYNNISSA